MQLYNYFRSSASWRVRIALAIKGLDYEYLPIHLPKKEQLEAPFTDISASRLVPVLKDGDHLFSQSLAIIEYLEETHPTPALLPRDALGRHRARALACDIACEVHPLNNLRVLRYLVHEMQLSEEAKNQWIHHWIATGFEAVERQLSSQPETGKFCHGDTPGIADLTLVPQVFNAQRFEVPLGPYPTLMRIHDTCMAHEAFIKTQPSVCPDAF